MLICGSPGTKLSTAPPTTSAIGYGTPARRDSQPSTTEQSSRKTTTWMTAMRRILARGLEHAVLQHQHAAGARGEVFVMRHQHESGATPLREADHGVEHLVRGLRIEVAGGLIGQHAGRLGHHGARERAALALAARELRRKVLDAGGQADFGKRFSCPLERSLTVLAPDPQR